MRRIFLDTCGILALVNKSDNLHQKVLVINESLRFENIRFFVTDYVLTAIANSLANQKFLAIKAIDYLLTSEDIEFIRISREIFDESLNIYRKFDDKAWGFTDTISFVVMKRHNIHEALTKDKHFKQFGFSILL